MTARTALVCALLVSLPSTAEAFCGTYVGSAGSDIYNEVSEVAMVRSGKRTTLSIRNDAIGDLDDFALVVPVPAVLDRDQIHTLDHSVFERLDAYSAPRLVEYECADFDYESDTDTDSDADSDTDADGDSDTDVDVEAEYVVGEYDVVILSAEGGDNLVGWLSDNGYAMPEDGGGLLQDYIDTGSYFLAAKVRPSAELFSGDSLSPLQFSYASDMAALPIRIGTLSSQGEQDLVIYGLNTYSEGALAIANYPEAEIEDECMWDPAPDETLGDFYEDRFAEAIDSRGGAAWVTEYAWGSGKCDPCTGTPPDEVDLATLGHRSGIYDLFFTRLHMRYTPEQATKDLTLYETGIVSSRQVRYISYDWALEDRWPICVEGTPEEPGSCDAEPPGSGGPVDAARDRVGCAAVPGGGGWALLALLALIRRRSQD